MAKNGNGSSDSSAPKGSLSKDAKKKLFAAADAADLKVAQAKDALDKVIALRSEAIGAIHSQCGSGPFMYQGRNVTIRSRVEKDAETGEVVQGGKATFYFVGPRDTEVEVID